MRGFKLRVSHGSGDAGFHGVVLQEAWPVWNWTGDAYAKRVLLTATGDVPCARLWGRRRRGVEAGLRGLR
jgi:hypothetical protein